MGENFWDSSEVARAHFEASIRQQGDVLSLADLVRDAHLDLKHEELVLRALDSAGARINRTYASDELPIIFSVVRSLALTLDSSEHLPLVSLPAEGTDRHVPVNVTTQLLLLVLMWLIVMTVPVAIQKSDLPAETQQTLNDYYAVIAGLAVTITFLIAPKLMKKNIKK